MLVTGRAVRADGAPAPGVVLLSYRLEGTITDAAGDPVSGATVVTRTPDRDFWTFSQPSNANGHYVSFFSASDEAGSDPVPLNVQVASGRKSVHHRGGDTCIRPIAQRDDERQASGRGPVFANPTTSAEPGAFYRGLLVGVTGAHGVVQPLAAHWPDGRGALLAAASVERPRHGPAFLGERLRYFLADAGRTRVGCRPSAWPSALPAHVPRDVGLLLVKR